MMLAEHMIRPVSRKYDKEEHAYPKEMEQVAELIGAGRSDAMGGAKKKEVEPGTVVNGGNMGAVTGLFGLCWGDVGYKIVLRADEQYFYHSVFTAQARTTTLTSRSRARVNHELAGIRSQPIFSCNFSQDYDCSGTFLIRKSLTLARGSRR